MKPHRPDSAKSARTRMTVDSQIGSHALNQSKFSETYSNGVKANIQKNNDFHKYVAEKNKDPKFKKFMEPVLPEIPEKMQNSNELSKLTSKPFERKNSKATKKVEEPPPTKKQQTVKQDKKTNVEPAKTFIDKSKKRMKLGSAKPQNGDNKNGNPLKAEPATNGHSNGQANINLTGFTLNVPGKPPQVIQEKKVKKKSAEEEQAERKARQRQQMFTELSEFVEEMQSRNLEYYPARYDQFVERSLSRVHGDLDVDIQKINIQDFIQEPNQRDYNRLMKKINMCDQKLKEGDNQSVKINSESSINLEEVIDGTEQEDEEKSSEVDVSVVMTSMSASDIRDRNMFLTEVMKNRLTQQQLENLQQDEQNRAKLIKLQNLGLPKEEQQPLEEENGYITEIQQLSTVSSKSINVTQKKNRKFLQKNKIEAGGQLYRQCDYLTPEEQKRLDDLINGAEIESPFQFTDMEMLRNRRIEEGIKLHRDIYQGSSDENVDVLNEAVMPKDPLLRKEAELNFLKQKINSVNSRLRTIGEVVVNKSKIQSLVKTFKEVTKVSKMGESLIKEKNSQFQQERQKMREAAQFIKRAQEEQEEVKQILRQMEDQYTAMEEEIERIRKMDEKELKELWKQDLNNKKRRVEDIQNEVRNFDQQLSAFVQMGEELRQQMKVIDEVLSFQPEKLQCQGYNEHETLQDIDELITQKWQASEQALREIHSITEQQ